MIHFDFILDDNDAELLMDCVHEEKCKMLQYASTELAKNQGKTSPEYHWYLKQVDYLDELKKKMHNKRVEE